MRQDYPGPVLKRCFHGDRRTDILKRKHCEIQAWTLRPPFFFSNRYRKNGPPTNDISLTFRGGEITTILGPNGCGKTTLVQCLNGASTVTAGQIFLNGQDFLKISPKERAREISLLPQVRTIIPAIPVKMLVEHGRFPYLGFSRRKSKEDTEIVNRAMEFTHISQYADQYVV